MKHKLILLALLAALAVPRPAAAQFFGVRLNALAAATGTLNLALEAAVTDRWSLEAALYWNPIDTPTYSTRLTGVQLGARRWFYETFVGHFLGVQATYASYIWGGRHDTYKGTLGGLGLSYGYAWMLSKRWNLTLEAGVGIYRMRDTQRLRTLPEYEPYTVHRYKRWAAGPSRAEVSFTYLF